MFALAARRLGYQVGVFSAPTASGERSPAGQAADFEVQAEYSDTTAVRQFAQRISALTFEFENIPSATADAAAHGIPVRPAGRVLHTTQHRLREKTFLQQAGLPLVPFRAVRSLAELHQGLAELGTPAVLKTAGWGYDGKGQATINSSAGAEEAWETVWRSAVPSQPVAGPQTADLPTASVPPASVPTASVSTREAVLEAFVDFRLEVSVVAARGLDGSIVDYPLFENHHANHILDVTVCPARVSEQTARTASRIARMVLERLGVVGVLCVEFFVTADGQVLINELAPRPHNSGHLTIEACVTCQFEQQLRALCGLPLGSTELLRPAAMANLLGDLWRPEAPTWSACFLDPQIKLHLYGKTEGRPGRKMGHLTATAGTVEEAERAVLQGRRRLMDQ